MKKLKALGISILVVAAAAFVSAIDLGDDYWTAPHIAILFLIGEVTYLAYLFWKKGKSDKQDGPDRPDELDES